LSGDAYGEAHSDSGLRTREQGRDHSTMNNATAGTGHHGSLNTSVEFTQAQSSLERQAYHGYQFSPVSTNPEREQHHVERRQQLMAQQRALSETVQSDDDYKEVYKRGYMQGLLKHGLLKGHSQSQGKETHTQYPHQNLQDYQNPQDYQHQHRYEHQRQHRQQNDQYRHHQHPVHQQHEPIIRQQHERTIHQHQAHYQYSGHQQHQSWKEQQESWKEQQLSKQQLSNHLKAAPTTQSTALTSFRQSASTPQAHVQQVPLVMRHAQRVTRLRSEVSQSVAVQLQERRGVGQQKQQQQQQQQQRAHHDHEKTGYRPRR
jgi:hypothetical protein